MTPEEMVKLARPIAEALLPTSATLREKALLTAEVAIILDKKPEVITTIWDPQRCPVNLLPYLAWALSVDVYNDDWDEQLKRDVISASPIVHRLKGTVFAVEESLRALGATAKITEWHLDEPVARRGTFRVDIRANRRLSRDDVFLSASAQRQIISQIAKVKPLSRFFTVTLGADFKSSMGIGSAFSGLAIDKRTFGTSSDQKFASGLGIGSAFSQMQIHRTSFIG